MDLFVRVSGDPKVIVLIFSFEYLIRAVLLPARLTSHSCSVSNRMFIHDSITIVPKSRQSGFRLNLNRGHRYDSNIFNCIHISCLRRVNLKSKYTVP